MTPERPMSYLGATSEQPRTQSWRWVSNLSYLNASQTLSARRITPYLFNFSFYRNRLLRLLRLLRSSTGAGLKASNLTQPEQPRLLKGASQ